MEISVHICVCVGGVYFMGLCGFFPQLLLASGDLNILFPSLTTSSISLFCGPISRVSTCLTN